jgi:hypothetical protein
LIPKEPYFFSHPQNTHKKASSTPSSHWPEYKHSRHRKHIPITPILGTMTS